MNMDNSVCGLVDGTRKAPGRIMTSVPVGRFCFIDSSSPMAMVQCLHLVLANFRKKTKYSIESYLYPTVQRTTCIRMREN
jgi:hypothetical protein